DHGAEEPRAEGIEVIGIGRPETGGGALDRRREGGVRPTRRRAARPGGEQRGDDRLAWEAERAAGGGERRIGGREPVTQVGAVRDQRVEKVAPPVPRRRCDEPHAEVGTAGGGAAPGRV